MLRKISFQFLSSVKKEISRNFKTPEITFEKTDYQIDCLTFSQSVWFKENQTALTYVFLFSPSTY